eukprot:312032_1
MNEEDEKCNESYPSEADDQYQEAIVTGSDGRRRVDVFKPTSDDIFSCIGQLDVEYDFMKLHKYRGFVKGTGTVIYVGNQNRYKNKSAYILTCAHNVRLSVIHCVKKTCDTYRRKRDSKGNKTKCIVCNQIYGYQKFVKPTKIIFRDRSIEYNNYGKTLENYECKELYVPDHKYLKHWKPKHGFDWAYLMFFDNGVYEKRLKTINIELINEITIFQKNKSEKEFGIFGYPEDINNMLVGMKTNKADLFEIRKNDKTKRHYLYQTGIDTKGGQSGSVLWYKQNKKINICGIHVGGSIGTKNKPQPYNICTLVDAHVMEILQQIKKNNRMLGIQVVIERVGINNMDFKVLWDDKNSNEYKEKDMNLNVQIKENGDCVFLEKYVEFKGNGKIMSIYDLEEDTMYSLRVKCVFKDNDDWKDAIVIAFRTNNVTFVDNSMIIRDKNDLDLFKKMLLNELNNESNKIILELLYRSNEQDTLTDTDKDPKAFHSACDGKGQTVVIIQTEQQHIFGGYTSIPWTSPKNDEYKTDEKAFLFLLKSPISNQLKVYRNKNNNGNEAVYHDVYYGPIFGDWDIVIEGSN